MNSRDDKRSLSIKSEKRSAKELGLKLTKNSGACTMKGDMYNDSIMLEEKSTSKAFFRLSSKILAKLFKEASQVDRIPILLIKFLHTPSLDTSVFIMSLLDYNDLTNENLRPEYLENKATFLVKNNADLTKPVAFTFITDLVMFSIQDFKTLKDKIDERRSN